MDSLTAFAKGQATRGERARVFDWDRAATLIRERGIVAAAAGLADDWEWTGGEILADGSPVPAEDTYTYLASTWAIPELDLGGEIIECWKYADETPGWDHGTYWPESAVSILMETP